MEEDNFHRIIKVTSDFFMQLGIKAVTMDFLADQLGISKRTLYFLFRDKNDLVNHCVSIQFMKYRDEVLKLIRESSNVIEALYFISLNSQEISARTNPLFFHDLKKYHREIYEKIFVNEEFIDPNIAMDILNRGGRENIFDPDLEPELVSQTWVELVRMVHDKNHLFSKNYTTRELMQGIFHPFIRGICTGKGNELLSKYFKKISGTPVTLII